MKKLFTTLLFILLLIPGLQAVENSISFGVVFPVNYYNTNETKGNNYSGTGFDLHFLSLVSPKVGFQAGLQLSGFSRYYISSLDDYEDGAFGTILALQTGIALKMANFGIADFHVTPGLNLLLWFPDHFENRKTFVNLGSGADFSVRFRFTEKVSITGGYTFNYYFFRLNPADEESFSCTMIEHLPRITLGYVF